MTVSRPRVLIVEDEQHLADVLRFNLEEEGYQVETWLAVDDAGRRAPWRRFPRLANLFGEQALFVLRRI